MTGLQEVLARWDGTDERPTAAWLSDVESTLLDVHGTGPETDLTRDQAWTLLGWAEEEASELSGRHDARLLEAAATAVLLLDDGALDARDVWLVAGLLRRGAEAAGLSWSLAVEQAARRLGAPLDVVARLVRQSSELPATHVEETVAGGLVFRRAEADLDVTDLGRRLVDREAPGEPPTTSSHP